MKKFLSLLLALTMVLSLVVVPARAHDGIGIDYDSWAIDVSSGNQNKTLTITGAAEGNTFTWSSSNSDVASVPASSTAASVAVTAKAAGTATITCTIKESSAEDAETLATKTCSVTVTNKKAQLEDSVSAVIFKSSNDSTARTYSKSSGSFTVYYVSSEAAALNQASSWSLTPVDISVTAYNNGSLSISKGSGVDTVTGSISVITAEAKINSGSYIAVTPSANHRVGQKLTFSLPAGVTNKDSSNASFAWTVKSTASGTPTVAQGTGKTFEWTPVAANAGGTFTVECVVKEGSAEVGTIGLASNIEVAAENYEAAFTGVTTNSAVVVYGSSAQYTAPIPKPYLRSVKSGIDNVPYESLTNVSYQSSNESIATVSSSGLVTARSTTGTATITVKFTYLDKDYTETYTIYNRAPSHTIPTSIQAGVATPYDPSTLALYADSALKSAGITGVRVTGISSVTSSSNCTVTSSGSGLSIYTYYVTGTTFGTATFKAVVTTSNGNYPVTFSVAVKPQATTYEDQYPEPVAYGNTYRYYVQVPSGFTSYYVLGTPNQTTEPNWTLTGTQYYGNNLYYLTDSNFVGGKCTLWLVTRTANGAYYCGQLTVYQKNYNINYNGVAGETVQFKHADFTNFMNEVSQARGDASKTGSYPYVTFNYVTFNYPTSTQGTLYYNGTAMSNSSYSGSFNSSTQITNLDNVTFVPYARTSAKSIPLTFTLSVTKYGANGAVVNRDLKYTGTVAVSIVREDIKYTAAPGDTIRFTDSDFLNYLRTQNGFNSNYYSIDYVTFDQSAVNALNEGVLYAYSTGFNAVKTTDKFYYTTTSYNQNALSDVTFRASAYAKTGTTVYIPFTIYARYGTTGTGTRQVSGTVAIKLAQTMNFVDVKPTDYFYDSVKWAVNSNITKGTSATTFSPYKTCTRAEIVTFLWRAAGSKTPTITRNPFTDVAPSMGMDYYYAILWASQNGIAAGTSATTFSPNATCTRAQIVTFLWRYSNKPAGYYSNPFTDVNKAEHAAYYDAILWAVGKGITKGTTATTFSPYGTCTRGEAVTFLYRAVNGK